MKIQVSENTKALLDEIGGFLLEWRGSMEIKVTFRDSSCFSSEIYFNLKSWKTHILHLKFYLQGKGKMDTFWLLGHEKLRDINTNALTVLNIEEVYESVYEPEFLQIIWNEYRKFYQLFGVFVVATKRICRLLSHLCQRALSEKALHKCGNERRIRVRTPNCRCAN